MTTLARPTRRMLWLLPCAAAALLGAGAALAADALTVFAAASLTDAIEEIAGDYRAATGRPAKLSFAASSTLAAQVAAGAPAQIFISANEQWMDYLQERGFIATETRISPIRNQLVLIAPSSDSTPSQELSCSADLAALLGPNGLLAVGDPDHVPAGIYAREALQHLGLWQSLEPRLARSQDVRAALVLVERGEAPLGIVYATDTRLSARVRVIGRFPPNSHAPMTYPFAIIAGERTAIVEDLFEYLTGERGLAVFVRHGFERN